MSCAFDKAGTASEALIRVTPSAASPLRAVGLSPASAFATSETITTVPAASFSDRAPASAASAWAALIVTGLTVATAMVGASAPASPAKLAGLP